MQKVKAVLFDLDGTLVNSLPEIYGGVRAALTELGFTPPSEAEVAAMIGRGVRVLSARAADRVGIPPESPLREELFAGIVRHWAESDGDLQTFYPGALEGVRALRSAGIKTAIVTNKLRDLTEDFVARRGIGDLFDTVTAGDDCERNKPAPDMLRKALAELGVNPSEAVMVGDSRNDALAARAAGVRAVLVETGYNEGEPISVWAKREGFDCVLPDVAALCRAVREERL